MPRQTDRLQALCQDQAIDGEEVATPENDIARRQGDHERIDDQLNVTTAEDGAQGYRQSAFGDRNYALRENRQRPGSDAERGLGYRNFAIGTGRHRSRSY